MLALHLIHRTSSRTRPERVQPLLDTLELLKLVRFTPEGAYEG